MTEFGWCSPSSILQHSGHLVLYHQGTAPDIDRMLAGTTLLAEIQFEQESFTEVLRHLCCEQVQARRVITSRRWNEKSIQFAVVGAATVECIATNGAHSSTVMSSGNTWFSSKVPNTTFKNSPDRCHSCHNLHSDSLGFCPNASSIQGLDGREEVIRRQQPVAKCLAHEDKHCLTVHHFRDCEGHDARREPHHVELPQFHFLEVIEGGTRSVNFALKFFGVGQSQLGLFLSDFTCKHCKHDCSQSPLSHWQVTS